MAAVLLAYRPTQLKAPPAADFGPRRATAPYQLAVGETIRHPLANCISTALDRPPNVIARKLTVAAGGDVQ